MIWLKLDPSRAFEVVLATLVVTCPCALSLATPAADASIAIDAGTALARASADAIVLGKRLRSVVDAAQVAARTRKVIRQNILWAILYNLTAVPLAAGGMLAPWMAAIGMSVSSLIVVLNALRLQRTEIVTEDFERNAKRANAAEKASILP